MLNNIPQVTKNLLLLNVFVFILSLILGGKGIDLNHLLSTHAIGSPLFQPYQVVTHMFAHAGFFAFTDEYVVVCHARRVFRTTLGPKTILYFLPAQRFWCIFTSKRDECVPAF